MKPHPAFLPLAHLRRWCAWQAEWNAEKERWEKMPYVAPDRRARVDVPAMWLTLDRARDLVAILDDRGARAAGLGILAGDLGDGWRLLPLDLDAAVSEGGSLKPWARALLDALKRHYAEWSPSGSGVHVLLLASESAVRALDEALEAALPKHVKAHRKFKRDTPADGVKAEAIEVLASGFVTMTGDPLPDSGTRIRAVTSDEMRVLGAIIATFMGANRPPPEDPPQPECNEQDAPTPSAPKARVPAERVIRAEGHRLDRFAEKLGDASFQIMWALWRYAGRSRDGWARASVPYARFAALPGLDRNSRLSRATIAKRIRLVIAGEVVRIATAPTPPKKHSSGLTTVYEVQALLRHRAEARAAPDDLMRVPVSEWEALGALPGRLLRLLVRLRFRFGTRPFSIAAREAGALIGVDRKAGAAALADLVKLGWLEFVARPDASRGLCGVYLCTTTHTPNPLVSWSSIQPHPPVQ